MYDGWAAIFNEPALLNTFNIEPIPDYFQSFNLWGSQLFDSSYLDFIGVNA